ncbi:MAG: major facilitator superfamily domain-containing protein, partial [Podila humilis]
MDTLSPPPHPTAPPSHHSPPSCSTIITYSPSSLHHDIDTPFEDRNSTIIPPHSSSPPLVRVGRMRWAILASGCLVLFGNYYAYDNPAALNKPLQQHLGLSDDEYAYILNLLYTVYSVPNIVLPWISGYIADRLGHRRILIWVSVIVVLGHMIVCLGVERRNVPVMIVGRVVFGMAESLSVVQSAMTIKYFRGQELAMALGVNLCMSRLGSVLNDVLTPLIWSRTNVDVAFWGGFVTCVLSLGSALVLVVLDRRQSRKLGDRREREEEDALGHAVRREEDGEEEEKEQEEKWQELSEDQDHEHQHQHQRHQPLSSSQTNVPKKGLAKVKKIVRDMAGFSLSTWILMTLACLLVGVIVPFNSIHAGFLQMRWYHDDPKHAAQVTTVPDLLAAVLVIPFGYFVDNYGHKSWLFMLTGLLIGSAHVALGLFRLATPIPALTLLGIATAINSLFQSAIPTLVAEEQIATVFGLYTSGINLVLVVVPLIVAKLMTLDPTTYTHVEIMFASIGFFGFILAVWL